VFSSIALALPGTRTAERLGGALTKRFGTPDDVPVKLALVLMPFHPPIIALHQRFANSRRQRAGKPGVRRIPSRSEADDPHAPAGVRILAVDDARSPADEFVTDGRVYRARRHALHAA
jgi:hypothetical protein